jgi:hypothetical protein
VAASSNYLRIRSENSRLEMELLCGDETSFSDRLMQLLTRFVSQGLFACSHARFRSSTPGLEWKGR